MSKTKRVEKKVTFPKKELLEMNLPQSAVEDTVIDHTRWSVVHHIIFEKDGKYYSTTYSVGATERQDELPWEYQESVECTEVVEKEITTFVWESVMVEV